MRSSTVHPVSLRNRLLSGGVWATGGRAAAAASALGVNALLARLLRPEELGAYFLTLSLVSITATIAGLGLSRTVVRLVADSLGRGEPSRARAAVRIVFRYGVLASVVVAGILALGVGRWFALRVFGSQLVANVVSLAAYLVVMTSCRRLLAETFRGFHDIRLATLFGGLLKSILYILPLALLWFTRGHSGLRQVLTLSVVAGGMSVLIAALVLRKKICHLTGDDDLEPREVLLTAWPLLAVSLGVYANRQAGLWVVGAFLPEQQAAIYGAVSRLMITAGMSLALVNAVVSPLIAEMHAQGKRKQLERMLRGTALLAALPSIAVLAVFVLAGRLILRLLYGGFYAQGAVPLAILSVGLLVGVCAGSSGLTLMMTGHQSAAMWTTIASAGISVCLALLLVGRHGLVGVAMATAAGLILQNLANTLLVRRNIGIWTCVGDPRHAWRARKEGS